LTDKTPRLSNGRTDWAHAHPYTAAAIATHAASTDRLDQLLTDPRFLLDTPPAPPLTAIPHAHTQPAPPAPAAHHRAPPPLRTCRPAERAAYLQLAARCARAPHLASTITTSGLPLPFTTDWASWRLQPPHRTITGHTGWVNAVAVGQMDGRTTIVSGGDDG